MTHMLLVKQSAYLDECCSNEPIAIGLPLRPVIERSQELCKAWMAVKSGDPAARDSVDRKMNDLIDFMLDHFQGQIDQSSVRKIMEFNGDRLIPTFLMKLTPPAVPVAVIRELLNKHRIRIRPTKVPAWVGFATRYGELLLDA